jgi:type II secretory pathway pseudopilin PulG
MRPARPSIQPDRGTTLVEVTVAMLVFGIFGAFLATLVLQTTRLTRDSGVRELSGLRASTVMQQVTKDLRTAVRIGPAADAKAFVEATPTRVVFHASVTPDIVLRTLDVQTTGSTAGLHRTSKRPDAGSVYPQLTYTSTDPAMTTTRRLENADLALTGLFSYVLRNGTTVSTVGPTELKDVVAVNVTVALDGDGPGRVPPVVLESTVRPFNP